MELIQNSKDLLYIVIAFCILWLTFFFAWLIYYFIMIMREIYQSIKGIKEKINKVDNAIREFKAKVEHSASYLSLISEGVKKITDVVKTHTKKGSGKKRT